ncbi:MAG: hypothetical protein ACK5JT_16415 [Hyphomicrobiaceae bacterium]
MRFATLVLTSLMLAALVSQADAREKRHRRYSADRDDGYSRTYRERPDTVDRRGLCQRDTGVPMEDLNLNRRCDREEFWNRIKDRGGSWN